MWPPDVCLSSLPVMAWRHTDVCNRHQKSQAREDPRVYFGKTWVSFSVSYGKSLRSLLRKLECDMQRLFCFGEMNHTIPIILLRAMLHLFFSSGKLLMFMPVSLLGKNTTNDSIFSFETSRC